VAYQGALGLDPDRILAQNEVLAVRPDLTVIFTLPVAMALARLSGTPQRAQQVSEDPAYLERVAAIYASLQGPHLRYLDASAPPEAVHATLLNLTLEFLEAAGHR
jgi:dTMP kinase